MAVASETTARDGVGGRRSVEVLQRLKRALLNPRWLALAVVLGAWQAYAGYRATRVIPTPGKVINVMWRALASGEFFQHLGVSMVRILLGFGAAMIVGIIVGILMGSRRSWEQYFKDLVLFGLALPGLLYAVFSVLLFGLSIMASLVGILGTSYPFVAVNITEGVKALDRDLLDMCRVYRVGRGKVVSQVVMPSLLPFVLSAVRSGFAIAWKASTLVEVFGAESGVGYMIRNEFDAYSVHGMLAWALLFGGVMLAIEYGILLPAERYFARWRPKVERVM